jgi:hypothetical protein
MNKSKVLFFGLLAVGFATLAARAEVLHLTNGDVIHGTLVAANNTEVTLKTTYGDLVIPKKDIERIDYQGGGEPSGTATAAEETPAPRRSATPADRAAIVLNITGRSFWYAFDSPDDSPADTRIRLLLYIGSARACTLVDEKPDTVDGATLYNSFTFSPTDSRVVETLEKFECRVDKSEDGQVNFTVGLPPEVSSGRQLVRMLYEVNDGDLTLTRWLDVVSRSFSVEVAPGKETFVILEQNADALDYSGFFKKTMKHLDLFQLNVLSTELRG